MTWWALADVFYPCILTSPCKRNGGARTLSLSRRSWNRAVDEALVRISASWSELGTYQTSKDFWSTLSRTKWTSISMCLVLAWKTGFATREPALKLSHHKTGVEDKGRWSSCIRDCSHDNSTAPDSRARYSDSVLDHATTCCFLEDWEINLSQGRCNNPW